MYVLSEKNAAAAAGDPVKHKQQKGPAAVPLFALELAISADS